MNMQLKNFLKTLATVDNHELIEDFLKSILTPNEISEVSSRWELVKQIDEGVSQRKIAENLGLSSLQNYTGFKRT